MPNKLPQRRPPKRLFTLSIISFLFAALLVASAVYLFLDNRLTTQAQRLADIVGSELVRTEHILRTAFQYESSSQASARKSLTPIPLEYHPSPFNPQSYELYNRDYIPHSYYSSSNLDATATVILGYSRPTLNSGKVGDLYLNILAWISAPALNPYDYSTYSRTGRDHIVIHYQTPSGKLDKLILSLESTIQPSKKAADIAGFWAPASGHLIVDGSAKGSVFPTSEFGYSHMFTARVRVDPPADVERAPIDVTKRVGLTFNFAASEQGVDSIVIKTHNVEGDRLFDIPHDAGETLANRLSEVHHSVSAISLIEVADDARRELLSRQQTAESPSESHLFDQMLASALQRKLRWIDPRFEGPNERGSNIIVTSASFTTDGLPGPIMLRLTLTEDSVLKQFYEEGAYLIWGTFMVLFILLSLFLLNHMLIIVAVRRLTTDIVAHKESPIAGLQFSAAGQKTEVGYLADSLQGLYQELRSKNQELGDQHQELVDAKARLQGIYDNTLETMKIVGHDIRTPLSAIRAILKTSEHGQRYVNQIIRASHVIGQLNEQALLQPKVLRVDICEFVRAVADGADHTFEHACVRAEISESGLKANTNLELLEEVVDAIVDNAKDFASEIAFSVFSRSESICVSIENNGCCIPNENLDRLFDPRFSDRSLSRTADGERHSGLGLFSAKLKATKIGARIEVSNTAVGVRFDIILPSTLVARRVD